MLSLRVFLLMLIVLASSSRAREQDGFITRGFSGQFSGTAAEIESFDPHDYVPEHYSKVRVAHGVLMSLVWLIIFPIGAIIPRVMRDSQFIIVHAVIQLLGFWINVAAAGMGIWMGHEIRQLGHYHPMIGLLLLGLLAVQPATEILNHKFYQTHPKMIVTAHVHLWLGRALLVVGAVQGGLGFLFAASFRNANADLAPRIAYGATAVTMWVFYICLGNIYPQYEDSWKDARKRGSKQAHSTHKFRNLRSNSIVMPSTISTRPGSGYSRPPASQAPPPQQPLVYNLHPSQSYLHSPAIPQTPESRDVLASANTGVLGTHRS